MAQHRLGKSENVLVSNSIGFPSNSKRDALFNCIAYDYSSTYWDGPRGYLRDVRWRKIFKISACAAASEFYESFQVRIDVYIADPKYQVKPY